MILILGCLALTPFGTPCMHGPLTTRIYLGYFLFRYPDPFNPALNPVLWSLLLELRWYVFFPMIFHLYLRSKQLFGALLAACWLLNPHIDSPDVGVLPIFMLGIVAADLIVRNQIRSPWYALAAIASLAAAITHQFLGGDPHNHSDPYWHLAAFFTLLAGIRWCGAVLASPAFTTVGAASYGIYIIHFPFAVAMWSHDVPAPFIFAASLGIGLTFWRYVERPLTAYTSALLGVANVRSLCYKVEDGRSGGNVNRV